MRATPLDRRVRIAPIAFMRAIASILLAWSLSTAAIAQTPAAPDRAAIERHLDAVFGGDDRVVRKWPDEVHYSVVGIPTDQHRAGVRRAMGAIADATGLAVSDVTDSGTAANIVLFFTDTLDELLPDPWFSRLLQQPDESLGAFATGIRSRFNAPGWIAAHAPDGDDEDVSLALVNTTVDNGDPVVLAMRMALSAFFEVSPSDAIRPSLMNSGTTAKPEVSAIDRALLAALYSERVESGAEYGDVKSSLIDLIIDSLKGI